MAVQRIGFKSGVAVVILTAAALALSAYLTFHDPTNLAGCSPDDPAGCTTVLTSKWSHWLGLPVSAAGLGTYGIALLCALSVLLFPSAFGWGIMFFSLTVAAGAAVWFTGLQFFHVDAMCPYCLATHTFGLAAWLLVVADGLRQGLALPNRIWFTGTLPASLVIAALVGGQIYDRYELRIELVDRWNSADTTFARADAYQQALRKPEASSSEEPVAPIGNAIEPRELELVDGKLSMQLGEYPILGDPDAPKFIGIISDYTCPACRRLHEYLDEAIAAYHGQFAVVIFPMSLDAKCNPNMDKTAFGHRNSCLLAKMGLAIWSISPQAFAEFTQEVYEPTVPPDRAEAVALADRLVGPDQLDKAMSNPLFDKMLYFSINLFYSPLVEKRALPTILTPKGVYTGLPESTEELHRLVEDWLDLTPPESEGVD